MSRLVTRQTLQNRERATRIKLNPGAQELTRGTSWLRTLNRHTTHPIYDGKGGGYDAVTPENSVSSDDDAKFNTAEHEKEFFETFADAVLRLDLHKAREIMRKYRQETTEDIYSTEDKQAMLRIIARMPNEKIDENDNTMLHYLAAKTPTSQNESLQIREMIKYLVLQGADPKAQNKDGQTPLDVAHTQDSLRGLKSKHRMCTIL